MPIYEYECLKCGEMHEALRKFSDKPLNKCPKCGGTLKKLISNTSFILKGTGWYKTDYASKPADSGKSLMQRKTQALNQKQKPRRELKQRAKQNLRQRQQLKHSD